MSVIPSLCSFECCRLQFYLDFVLYTTKLLIVLKIVHFASEHCVQCCDTQSMETADSELLRIIDLTIDDDNINVLIVLDTSVVKEPKSAACLDNIEDTRLRMQRTQAISANFT